MNASDNTQGSGGAGSGPGGGSTSGAGTGSGNGGSGSRPGTARRNASTTWAIGWLGALAVLAGDELLKMIQLLAWGSAPVGCVLAYAWLQLRLRPLRRT